MLLIVDFLWLRRWGIGESSLLFLHLKFYLPIYLKICITEHLPFKTFLSGFGYILCCCATITTVPKAFSLSKQKFCNHSTTPSHCPVPQTAEFSSSVSEQVLRLAVCCSLLFFPTPSLTVFSPLLSLQGPVELGRRRRAGGYSGLRDGPRQRWPPSLLALGLFPSHQQCLSPAPSSLP